MRTPNCSGLLISVEPSAGVNAPDANVIVFPLLLTSEESASNFTKGYSIKFKRAEVIVLRECLSKRLATDRTILSLDSKFSARALYGLFIPTLSLTLQVEASISINAQTTSALSEIAALVVPLYPVPVPPDVPLSTVNVFVPALIAVINKSSVPIVITSFICNPTIESNLIAVSVCADPIPDALST